jgi:hypothetical protein
MTILFFCRNSTSFENHTFGQLSVTFVCDLLGRKRRYQRKTNKINVDQHNSGYGDNNGGHHNNGYNTIIGVTTRNTCWWNDCIGGSTKFSRSCSGGFNSQSTTTSRNFPRRFNQRFDWEIVDGAGNTEGCHIVSRFLC